MQSEILAKVRNFRKNDLGDWVKIKDMSTLRTAPTTEFQGGSCCDSRIGWKPNDALQDILGHPPIYILRTGDWGGVWSGWGRVERGLGRDWTRKAKGWGGNGDWGLGMGPGDWEYAIISSNFSDCPLFSNVFYNLLFIPVILWNSPLFVILFL